MLRRLAVCTCSLFEKEANSAWSPPSKLQSPIAHICNSKLKYKMNWQNFQRKYQSDFISVPSHIMAKPIDLFICHMVWLDDWILVSLWGRPWIALHCIITYRSPVRAKKRSIQIVCEVLFMLPAVCFSNGGRKEIQHTLSDNIWQQALPASVPNCPYFAIKRQSWCNAVQCSCA